MKKVVSILIIIITMYSFSLAESEITFQKIPWLSNENTTYKLLADAGYIRIEATYPELSKNNLFIVTDDDGENYRPDYITTYETVCKSLSLGDAVKGRIAGYPVKNLSLSFAYNGDFQLIAVTVELIKAEYNDILAKLEKVYGDGKQTVTEEGIIFTIWKGANNTAVLLYTENDGYNYTLIYGRLDAADILADCVLHNADDVSGL